MRKFIEDYGFIIWVVMVLICIVFLIGMLIGIYSCEDLETRIMRVCHIENNLVLLEDNQHNTYAYRIESNEEFDTNDICLVKLNVHNKEDITDDVIIEIINEGKLQNGE